jgi:spore maturation protein CgeB
MRIVLLGLSITSSWGNGHATNYRALMRALDERGHDVLFLERDVPWYAAQRDLPDPPWAVPSSTRRSRSCASATPPPSATPTS